MKLKLRKQIRLAGEKKKVRRRVQATALGLFGLTLMAQAQSVIVPPPSVSVTPPAIEALGPGEMQVFPPNSAVANLMDELHPLQWGPVTVRPHVFYQYISGSGIRFSTNQPPAYTIIQTLSPGVLFVLGTHWTLDYTPTLTFYSNTNFQNTVNHAATLTGGTVYDDWTLGLSQGFTDSSSLQVETGTQLQQENFSTFASASRPLNSKMSVDLGASQDLSFPSGFQSSEQWSTMDWLNYQFWPRLVVGAGAGLGFVITSPDEVFEQLQGRVNWRATDKISLGINGGAEFTQFPNSGIATLVNPVFGASIQYQPFHNTQLSLSASRTISTSFLQGQFTENTSVNAGLSQRLLQKFYLDVGAGYNMIAYVTAPNTVSNNRTDDTYSFNVQLRTTFLKRMSAAVFYRYDDNVSTAQGFSFLSRQIGFNVGVQF